MFDNFIPIFDKHPEANRLLIELRGKLAQLSVTASEKKTKIKTYQKEAYSLVKELAEMIGMNSKTLGLPWDYISNALKERLNPEEFKALSQFLAKYHSDLISREPGPAVKAPEPKTLSPDEERFRKRRTEEEEEEEDEE